MGMATAVRIGAWESKKDKRKKRAEEGYFNPILLVRSAIHIGSQSAPKA
jgi:hypothetical protein